MASTYLIRTTGTPDSRRNFTISTWFKKTKISSGTTQMIFTITDSGVSDPRFFIGLASEGIQINESNSGGTGIINLVTNAQYRDVNSWYHLVCAVDTTQSTSTDRVKLYINGEQVTSFSSTTYPSQNQDVQVNLNRTAIGSYTDLGSNYFEGLLAHYHYCDGNTYAASDFGETDSTTGEWKPITSPSVTYGTNGFFLKFENASSFGEDSSGNDNDFTSSGSPTQNVDTPANIFCTMNPLVNSGISYENTNLSVAGGADNNFGWGTLAGRMDNSSAGWYYEMKVDCGTTIGSGGAGMRVGLGSFDYANSQSGGLGTDGGWSLSSDTGKLIQNTSGTYNLSDNGGSNTINLGVSSSVGDIINVAWKNGKVYIGINGTYYANDGGSDGDPANELNPSFTISSTYISDAWMPLIASSLSNGANGCDFNFGNGYFGTTAVTSGNQDDAGYGTFEYDVPTGYYALCTKNINTYG